VHGFCPSPTYSVTPEKYRKSLRALPYATPRLISKMQSKESDSGISSAASVGNSPSSVVPSQMLEAHGSVHGSMFNQFDLALSSSKVFSSQHVDHPCPLVHSQLGTFNQFWNSPHTTAQLIAAGTYPLQNLFSDSPQPYQITKYHPPTVHTTAGPTTLAYSQSTNQTHPTLPLSEFHSHTSLLTHLSKPNLFNNFLNTWAQNQDNPTLLKPPPSSHFSPPNTQGHHFKPTTNTPAAATLARHTSPQHTYTALQISPTEPVHSSTNTTTLPSQQPYPKTTHKISSHSHSRLKPYTTIRPPSSMGFLSQEAMPLPSQQPVIPDPITSIHPADHLIYYNFPSLPQHNKKPSVVRLPGESFSPQSTPNSTISYTLPAIISKGKGKKKKMSYDED
jgi:hypothetical protein